MRRRDFVTVAAATTSAVAATPAPAATGPIGFALGSGALHGWAHIGIVRGCVHVGLQPHAIAGSNVGAAIGAATMGEGPHFWAAGYEVGAEYGGLGFPRKITPDMTTLGKIIGGGMPVGVVAGRAKFMDTFDGGMWRYGDNSMPTAGVTFFAGTFVRHPFAIAAAHASLSYLKSAGPQLQEGVNRKTTRLAETLNGFFSERGVRIFVAHFASQMFIRVSEESELATLFFYHMRERGVHAFLVGEALMRAADPGRALAELIN